MSKAITAIFVLAISVALSGCLITTRPNRGHSHQKARKGRTCHPSEYWDGHRCKHKGHKKAKHKRKKHKKHKKHHDHRKHD